MQYFFPGKLYRNGVPERNHVCRKILKGKVIKNCWLVGKCTLDILSDSWATQSRLSIKLFGIPYSNDMLLFSLHAGQWRSKNSTSNSDLHDKSCITRAFEIYRSKQIQNQHFCFYLAHNPTPLPNLLLFHQTSGAKSARGYLWVMWSRNLIGCSQILKNWRKKNTETHWSSFPLTMFLGWWWKEHGGSGRWNSREGKQYTSKCGFFGAYGRDVERENKRRFKCTEDYFLANSNGIGFLPFCS